jgi:hypothetical protein
MFSWTIWWRYLYRLLNQGAASQKHKGSEVTKRSMACYTHGLRFNLCVSKKGGLRVRWVCNIDQEGRIRDRVPCVHNAVYMPYCVWGLRATPASTSTPDTLVDTREGFFFFWEDDEEVRWLAMHINFPIKKHILHLARVSGGLSANEHPLFVEIWYVTAGRCLRSRDLLRLYPTCYIQVWSKRMLLYRANDIALNNYKGIVCFLFLSRNPDYQNCTDE